MRRIQPFPAAVLFGCALFYVAAASASPAHVRVGGPLQAQPLPKAPASGTVKLGAPVDIVERKGFWVRVRSGTQTGWLKLDRLSMDAGVSAREIAALASGRTGSNNVVSASGGRGLNAADLSRAAPDSAAVSALSRPAVSETAVEQFARTGGLKTRHINYMPSPKTAGNSARGPR